MSGNRHMDETQYPQAVTEWLEFGTGHFHILENASDLGRFGPASAGALAIEATALYAFVHGLASSDGAFDLGDCAVAADECTEHGLAAFRYCLHTHASHPREVPDDLVWGGTGMSPKMADQMALAAEVLGDALEDRDREQFARLVEYEADCNILLPYHLEHVDHGFYHKRPPVPTERFGRSYPESNAWRANILARALLHDPDHGNADEWRESMLMHLTNTLCTPADAEDDTVVDGRPIRDWHAGANLHPNFALEHHGFFHPGYVNRALLSLFSAAHAFDDAGVERPESLMRNVSEVWDVQRRLLLWDGRVAYPAGNDYPRYCWGLLYQLPVLVFAGHELDDPVARWAELRLANLMRREQQDNGDGSFCACRLETWERAIEDPNRPTPRRPAPSVYYRTQVDFPYYAALAHWWHRRNGAAEAATDAEVDEALREPFIEPDCGLVFQRSPRRFAAWSWNADGGVQGTVLPRGGDHLAEWRGNLVSRFQVRGSACDRRVLEHSETTFPGGFATWGRLDACDGAIEQTLGLAALPDGHTTLYFSRARAVQPVELLLHEGMCLNIANDLFNGNSRSLHCARSNHPLPGYGSEREEMAIESPWLNVDDMLGIVALDGHERFTVLVDGRRRAIGQSLCYDEILHPYVKRDRNLSSGALVEDSAVALVASIDAEDTARWPAWNVGPAHSDGHARAVTVRGLDDVWYLVAMGFRHGPDELLLPLTMEASGFEMLVGDSDRLALTGDAAVLTLDPCEMLVVALGVHH